MRILLSISYVLVIIQLNHVVADKHTYGSHYTHDWNLRRSFHRTVIDDVNKVPKNYTLYYKYFGSKFKDVMYFEININTHSSGDVNVRNNQIDATVHINNAYNVTATISIFGTLPANLPRYVGFPKSDFNAKSLTFIHVKNATEMSASKLFQNSIGKRRWNDKLIHFESKKVRNMSRFPSHAFEYSGDEYITYVGFSFDSPTAIALINSTYVGEQEFNAVVYDLSSAYFIANISVYGNTAIYGTRPNGFEGVI